MPVPSTLADVTAIAASNSPTGGTNVFPELDDYLRAGYKMLADLRDGNGQTAAALVVASLTVTGNTTLGNAASDTLAINGTAVACANGLNFDSNTLVIDATNNRVGVGVAAPGVTLDVTGKIRAVGTNAANSFGSGDDLVKIRNTAAGYFGINFDVDALPGAAIVCDGDVSGAGDIVAATAVSTSAGTLVERLRITSVGNVIPTLLATPPTLSANLQMVVNLTSNTNLRFSVRGSDGVTRVGNITLA